MVRWPAVSNRFCAVLLLLLLAAPSLAAANEPDLIVGTRHAPPFSMKDSNGEWIGIGIGLWRVIADDLKLSFEFRELEIDELLEGLHDGSLDVAVTSLTITTERERKVDFSHPFYWSGLAIATPAQFEVGVLGVLKGFATMRLFRALALMIGLVWLAGALVWFFERHRNPEHFGGGTLRGMGEAFWWAAVTMTTVGYGDKAPRTAGGRIFAMLWMCASLVLISGLTAAIASALTLGNLQPKINGLDDLRRYRVATVKGTTSHVWLERNGIRTREFSSAQAGLGAVAQGQIEAAVYDAPILQYLAVNEFEGQIRVLSKRFDPQMYALAMQHGSALREPVNRSLLRHLAGSSWLDQVRSHIGEHD